MKSALSFIVVAGQKPGIVASLLLRSYERLLAEAREYSRPGTAGVDAV